MEFLNNVIRDIELLPLTQKGMKIAKELLKQIDMQVIFWINSELKFNVGSRHSQQMNQFWVTVKTQDDPKEFERLILAGLYRGIQERKRYFRIWKNNKYVQQLKTENRVKQYYEFLEYINAFISSLDVEMFLKQYDIVTSEVVINKKFQNVCKLLEEYIEKRRRMPHYHWYREAEIKNLIEFGNFWRRGYIYQKELKKLFIKVNPQYIKILESISYEINNILKKYDGKNGEELISKLIQYIVNLFQLEEMICFYRPIAKTSRFKFSDGECTTIFSYIPEDYPEQDLLIEWHRLSSQFIGIIREIYDYKIPDIGFNLIRSEQRNEYANVSSSEYYISCTTGHISSFNSFLKQYDIYKNGNILIIKSLGEYEYKKYLLRFAIFFMTAHEYAHILNGDCDRAGNLENNLKKELLADEKAKQMVETMIPFQYRLTAKLEDGLEEFQYYFERGEFEKAQKIIRKIPEARKQEIEYEVKCLCVKCRQDNVILREAIKLVNHYRKQEIKV